MSSKCHLIFAFFFLKVTYKCNKLYNDIGLTQLILMQRLMWQHVSALAIAVHVNMV
jgi:hypothetical protein